MKLIDKKVYQNKEVIKKVKLTVIQNNKRTNFKITLQFSYKFHNFQKR